MSAEANDAQPFGQQTRSDAISGRNLRMAILSVGVLSLGIVTAKIAGADIPSAVFVVAIVVLSIVAVMFTLRYWFRSTHTPEETAALSADYRTRHDRMKFAKQSTKYKREVLQTGVEGRAVITAIGDLRVGNEFEHLLHLELDVTLGAQPPYAVSTGENVGSGAIGSVAVGRQLVVRVDRADSQRVAVDWDESLRLRQQS